MRDMGTRLFSMHLFRILEQRKSEAKRSRRFRHRIGKIWKRDIFKKYPISKKKNQIFAPRENQIFAIIILVVFMRNLKSLLAFSRISTSNIDVIYLGFCRKDL